MLEQELRLYYLTIPILKGKFGFSQHVPRVHFYASLVTRVTKVTWDLRQKDGPIPSCLSLGFSSQFSKPEGGRCRLTQLYVMYFFTVLQEGPHGHCTSAPGSSEASLDELMAQKHAHDRGHTKQTKLHGLSRF